MKSANTNLRTALLESHAVTAVPRLVAEWNMNRYFGLTIDNTPAEDTDGYDIELFPIESIVKPERPTKGINKARINQSFISDDYVTNWQPRFYIADAEDYYKYWTSPQPSTATGTLSNCRPHVIYDEPVTVNKIVIGLENSWASPNAFTIETTTDAVTWTAVPAANISAGWEASGQIILYWSGTAWSSTVPATLDATTAIRGVRMTVTSLKGGFRKNGSATTYTQGGTTFTTDGKNAHFNLIEISARRESDLTSYLIDVDDTFDMSEVSNLYPIGTLTSNVGGVRLWNADNTFNRENTASPFYRLLEPNVQLTLDYVYTVAGSKYTVRQFRMYTDGPWSGQGTEVASVGLTDFSKFFQETTPSPSLWENLTVPEIIWRLCDSVGFVNYKIDQRDDRVTQFKIPVFWVSGEESLWEVFDELAKASQTAIYFDGNGVLQVRTREFAFDDVAASDWTLRGRAVGSNLSNIISLEPGIEQEANHVKVTYQTTKWADYQNGQPALQVLWEPEGTETLRATPLVRTLGTSDTYLWISPGDVNFWPYTGLVNIQGELIRYDGKQYVYYTTGNVRNVVVVNSEDEKKKFADKTPESLAYKNHFIGSLKISERGVWNSENRLHDVEASGYSVRHVVGGVRRTGVAGFRHLRNESKVQLASGPLFKSENDLLIATRGQAVDSGYYHYGTKFSFVRESGRVDQRAGITIHNQGNANEDAYYIEITPSNMIDGADRAVRHELIFYTRTGGINRKMGPNNGKGVPVAIAEGIEYELDITYMSITGGHRIQVWLNGRIMMTVDVLSNTNAFNGRFGIFTRGRTKAEFEYLYAIRRQESQPADDFSFLDRVDRGYVGGQWDREWVYRWRTSTRRTRRGSTKVRSKFNQQFFDEFGPIVHEVREYDVKFDPAPVLNSRLYSSNDWSTACIEYRANPFGAEFIVANTSRHNAVVNGDDNIIFRNDSPISQVLNVIGRALNISEADEVVAESASQIAKRGKVETELTSPWIQSKAMAETLAKWIRRNFGYGNENLSASVFGNPLIEVGDVVDIDYPAKGYNGEKFFVTAVSTSFSNGIETKLSLRRVKPLV